MSVIERLLARYSASYDPVRTERRLELVVVVLALFLLLQVLLSLVQLVAYDGPAPRAPATDALTVADLREAQLIDDASSQALIARPLFWETRRPVAAVAEPVVAEETETRSPGLKNVTLVGVFGGGDTGGAILVVKGKKRRVVVGDSVDGWRLESVAPDRAVFLSGGERDEKVLVTASLSAAPEASGQAEPEPAAGQPLPAGGEDNKPEPELTLGGMRAGKT